MEVVDNASDENNENTRRKATVVPIKIEYVWEDKPFNNVDVQKSASIFIPKMKEALDFEWKVLKWYCFCKMITKTRKEWWAERCF